MAVDYHVFSREIPQMLVLALPGVAVASVLTALFAIYVLPFDWGWNEGLAFGAMLSATDPVAVVALLKELGASQRLSLLIEGESLFNDGTAMVLFIVFADAMAGEVRTGAETVAFFAQLSFGGIAVGATAGWLTVKALQSLHFDIVAQIATTVFAAYGTFVLAEATPVHVSGVLAVVALGLSMSSGGRTAVHAHETLHEFWEMVEYLANTIVFVLSGAVIMERGFNSDFITAVDWLYLLLLYVVLNVVRLFTLMLLWPILKNLGYGITWQEILVVAWSGLRGAVGLVLALLVAEGDRQQPENGARFLFYMAGIAVLTLVVNGTTTGTLLKYMGLVSKTQASELMYATALHHIEHHTLNKHKELRADNTYTSVDWVAVETFMGNVFDELYEQLHALQEHHKFVQAAKEGGAAHFVRTHCSRMACCPRMCPCCASCVPREQDGVTPASPALKSQVALHLSPRKTATAAPVVPGMDDLDLGAGVAADVPRVASIRIPVSPAGPRATGVIVAARSGNSKTQRPVSLPAAVRHSGALHVELSTIDEVTGRSQRTLGAVTPMPTLTPSAESTPFSDSSPAMDSKITPKHKNSLGDDGMCGAARVTRSEAAGQRRHRSKRRRKHRHAKRQGSATVRNSIADVHEFSSQRDLTPVATKEHEAAPSKAAKSDGYATDEEDSEGDDAISQLTATSEESIYTDSSRSDLNSDSSVGETEEDGDSGESDASIAGSVSSMKGRLQEAAAVHQHQQQVQAAADHGIASRSSPRSTTPVAVQGRSMSEISMHSDDSSRQPVRLEGRPPLAPLRPTINTSRTASARSVTFDAKRADAPSGLRQRSASMQGSGRDSPSARTPTMGGDMSELRSYGHHEDFRADTLRRRSTTQGSDEDLQREMVQEARYRFFNLLKAEYWVLFETGMVGQAAVTQLQEAASSCQDIPEGPLCDFDIVQRLIHSNPLRDAVKYVCKCLPSLSQWWLLESLYFEFDLVFGFIEGHKAVHHIFPKVMRNRAVARKLIKESQRQVQHGLRYMSEVEQTLPELAGAVKTKHVMRALIHDIGNVAKRLLHHGEIEQREYQGITEKVYRAWKNVKITSKAPSEADLLRNVGYLADLDDALFDDLYKHSQRRVFQDGEVIMTQGEKSHGFLIIVRGAVDITRRMKVGTSGSTPKPGDGHRYTASHDAAGRFELGTVAAAGPGVRHASELDVKRRQQRPGRMSRSSTVTGASAEAMARSALDGAAAEEGTISASRMDSQSSTGSGRRAFLTRFKSGAIPEQFETRAVDRVSSGAVVGLLAMLTGQRTLVASTACGPVVAVHFQAADIFRLLKSRANPDLSIPRRIAAPLEEVLCRMAAVIVAEALLEAELGVALKPAQIRQIIQDTEFVRPEPKRPICIPYRAILLTGAELKPRNRRTALLADRLYVERQRTLNPALRAAQRAKRQHSARLRVLSANPSLGAGAAVGTALPTLEAARATSASAVPWSGNDNIIQAGKSLSDPDVWSARARLSRTADIPDAAACVGIMDEIDEQEDSDDTISSDTTYGNNIYAGEAVGDGDGADEGIQAPKAQSGSFMGAFMETLTRTIGLDSAQQEDQADDAYDPNYHAKYSAASKGLHELQDAEFVVVRRAFAFLDLPPKRKDGDQPWRWFSKGTRLLLLPDKHARVFSQQHANLLAEVATKRQLRHVGQRAQASLRPTAKPVTVPAPTLKKSAPPPLVALTGAGDAEFIVHSGAMDKGLTRPPPASGIRGVVTPVTAPPTTASAKAFWQSHSLGSPNSFASGGAADAVPHGLISLGAAPTDDQLHTVDMASHGSVLWQSALSTGANHISSVLWRRRSALQHASKRWWQVQGQADQEYARVAVYQSAQGGELLAPIFVNSAQASTLAHHKVAKSPLAARAAVDAPANTLGSKSLPPSVRGHTAQLPHPSADLSFTVDPHSAADAHGYLLGVLPPRRSLRQQSKAVSAWRAAAMREQSRGTSLRDAWAHAQCAVVCRSRAKHSDWRVPLPTRARRGRRTLQRSMSASRHSGVPLDGSAHASGFTSDTNETAAALSANAAYRARPKAFRGPACTDAFQAPSNATLNEFVIGPAPTAAGTAGRRGLGSAVGTANSVQRSAMLQHNSRVSSFDSLPSLVGDAEVYDASLHVAPTYSAMDAALAHEGSDDTRSLDSAASAGMIQRDAVMLPQQHSDGVISLSSVASRGPTDMPTHMTVTMQHVPGGVSDSKARGR